MKFDKNAVFYITEDGIPVVLGAGDGLPFCSAWDKKEPREYKLEGFFVPVSYDAFEEARTSFHADS